jgi:hypothetical protein
MKQGHANAAATASHTSSSGHSDRRQESHGANRRNATVVSELATAAVPCSTVLGLVSGVIAAD